MIILSLLERHPAALRRAILTAPQKAGAVEVRLDSLRRASFQVLQALFEGAPRPLIATCRRASDGGLFEGSERERVDLLWAAVRAGASYVDVEHGSQASSSLLGLGRDHPGIGIILSHHDRNRMPKDLFRLYRRMAALPGVKVVKIVGMARSLADNLLARDLLERARTHPVPLASFCMGGAGVASRIMAVEWGSWATYACMAEGQESAKGQVTLADLVGVYRIDEIDDETRLAGIIGTPLGHSLSPVVHNAAYHADGLNFRYLPLEVNRPSGLREIQAFARAMRLRGMSVTAPYKMAVMRQLDRVEPLARRVGAVNTLVFEGRRLVGFNTDATGGMAALSEALHRLHLEPAGLTAAIVGSGGAARALAHGLAAAGAKVLVASRSERPGRALARSVGGRYLPPSRLSSHSYEVLVNATPIGMAPRNGRGAPRLPVPAAAVKGRLVYEVIYQPEATSLITLARKRGIAVLGGLEMLLRQAAEQYELFTGRTAPLSAMREAARQALGARAGG
ncbi:MAG: shikimate dehydrogenase [Candidatus Polarisedimenticolia bacterium]